MIHIAGHALDYYNNFQMRRIPPPPRVSSVISEIYQYIIQGRRKDDIYRSIHRCKSMRIWSSNRNFENLIFCLRRDQIIGIMLLIYPNVYFRLPDFLKCKSEIKCSFEKTAIPHQFTNYNDHDCMFKYINE